MKRYRKIVAITLSAAMLAGCGFTNRRTDEAESTPSYIDTTTPTPTPPESVAESVTVPADTVGLADSSIPDSSIAAAVEPTLEPTVVPQEPLIEDKMDSLNTISQDTLINLQSLTAKRDQTYDLVSNALKSFNTVLVGNANNI